MRQRDAELRELRDVAEAAADLQSTDQQAAKVIDLSKKVGGRQRVEVSYHSTAPCEPCALVNECGTTITWVHSSGMTDPLWALPSAVAHD